MLVPSKKRSLINPLEKASSCSSGSSSSSTSRSNGSASKEEYASSDCGSQKLRRYEQSIHGRGAEKRRP